MYQIRNFICCSKMKFQVGKTDKRSQSFMLCGLFFCVLISSILKFTPYGSFTNDPSIIFQAIRRPYSIKFFILCYAAKQKFKSNPMRFYRQKIVIRMLYLRKKGCDFSQPSLLLSLNKSEHVNRIILDCACFCSCIFNCVKLMPA